MMSKQENSNGRVSLETVEKGQHVVIFPRGSDALPSIVKVVGRKKTRQESNPTIAVRGIRMPRLGTDLRYGRKIFLGAGTEAILTDTIHDSADYLELSAQLKRLGL